MNRFVFAFALAGCTLALRAAGMPDAPSPGFMAAQREDTQKMIEGENERIRLEKLAARKAAKRAAEARARALREKKVVDPRVVERDMLALPPLMPSETKKKKPSLFSLLFGEKKGPEPETDRSYSAEISGIWTLEQAKFFCKEQRMHLGTKREYYLLWLKEPGLFNENFPYWTSEKPFRGKGVMMSHPDPLKKRIFFLAPVRSKAKARCFYDAKKGY